MLLWEDIITHPEMAVPSSKTVGPSDVSEFLGIQVEEAQNHIFNNQLKVVDICENLSFYPNHHAKSRAFLLDFTASN